MLGGMAEWSPAQIEALLRRVGRLEATVRRLTAANARLKEQLEQSRRAGKRQSAPFSKGEPTAVPKKPGRKTGPAHGEHHRRAAPRPERVDESYEATLPERCPGCGGGDLQAVKIVEQYQTEIATRPIVRRFKIHVGCCGDCGKRVQGRHRLQTTDALGAAAAQLGPKAHALMTLANKGLGLSHGKVAKLLKYLGIQIGRATSARSMLKTAERCGAAHEQVRQRMRHSEVIVPDETGWRIGGVGAWLHVAVGDDATCYMIDRTRSAQPLAQLIGWDYSGWMVHDRWPAYDRFDLAEHQTCLGHLWRYAEALLETARGRARSFPDRLIAVLREGLALRDRWDAEAWPNRHGLAIQTGKLRRRLLDALPTRARDPAACRLAASLRNRVDEVFTFLTARARGSLPLDATNYRAEQAIRPAVVNRKVWGGNRTERGAEAQSVLMTVLQTCTRQAIDTLAFLAQARCATVPVTIFGR
jgi:transposase